MAVQRLAGRLAQRLPWLARGHIGALCHTLSTLGLDDTGWTAQDVLDLLDRRNAEHGLYSVPSSSQRDPLALLAHQLRAALWARHCGLTPYAAGCRTAWFLAPGYWAREIAGVAYTLLT